MMPLILPHDHPAVPDALRAVLETGGTLIFPTDTVYGLGGNPWDDRPLARVRALKQRDAQQPFTLHLPSVLNIASYACLTPSHHRQVQHLLPGPITVLLPASPGAPPATVLDGTVGIRVPDHPFFADILGAPVFGTSVNRHGEPPLNDIDRIIEAFHSVDLIVTGTVGGTASAIVDLTTSPPGVLRGTLPPGARQVLDEE